MSQQSVLDALGVLKKATADEIANYLGQCTAGVHRCLGKLRATRSIEYAGNRIGKDKRKARYWKRRE